MGLTKIQERVVVAMLQAGIDRGHAHAYKADSWGKKGKTSVTKDRIQVTMDDGNALVGAGLLTVVESGTVGYKLTDAGVAFALPRVEYEGLDLEACLRHILDLAYFGPDARIDGQTAIPAIYAPGKSKLVLVLGENAGGKSFFRRIVSIVTHKGRKVSMGQREIKRGPFPVHELIHLSMQGRTTGDFGSSMVYGTEDWQSTGENSASTVHTGINTVNGRTHTAIIYWDEPDIGMSAGSAAGTGVAIREFMENMNPLVQGVFITSHSPALVRQLEALDPHYLYLGNADGPATLADWFVAQQNPTPVSPKELMDCSHDRYRLIQKILNSKE